MCIICLVPSDAETSDVYSVQPEAASNFVIPLCSVCLEDRCVCVCGGGGGGGRGAV